MRNFYRVAKLRIKVRSQDFTHYVEIFDINNLRMQFSVNKSLSWAANSAVIKVWNLSQTTRNLIKDFGDEVELWAGYGDDSNLQLLFVGQTTTVYHNYEQPEIVSCFECADGNKYINQAFNSFSFGAGTPAKEVINTLAGYLKLKVVIPPSDDLVYATGFKSSAPVKDALFKACEYLGLQFVINNDLLSIYPKNPRVTGAVYAINEATGMISIPQRFTFQKQTLYGPANYPQTGYRVTASLKPEILPGNFISITSSHLGIANQTHLVQTIRHNGDTFGAEWISSMEVTLVP